MTNYVLSMDEHLGHPEYGKVLENIVISWDIRQAIACDRKGDQWAGGRPQMLHLHTAGL